MGLKLAEYALFGLTAILIKEMKLSKFRIINCFGFRDSGEIKLESPSDIIYLLGRNSSGKSSVLKAIESFEAGVVPSEEPNFINFKTTNEQPSLVASFTPAILISNYAT